MSERLEEGFIKEFCKHLQDTNTPQVYNLWTALTVVSSVLGRRCYLQNGFRTVYPNLYTLLIGPASVGKSTPISVGAKLMSQMDSPPYLLSNKLTPEALIQSLEESPTNVEGTVLTKSAVGVAFLSEYGTFVDKNSDQNGMTTALTDLWDNLDHFEYMTRGRGKEHLYKVCLNLIAGVTPGYLKSVTPISSIENGYATRLMLIWSDGAEVRRRATETVSEERSEALVQDLNEIAKLRGAFRYTPEAFKFYTDTFDTWWNDPNPLLEDDISRGLAGRRMHIFQKLAVLLSASNRNTQMVQRGDCVVALKILQYMEKALPRVLQKISGNESSDVTDAILAFIQKRKTLRRSEITAKFLRRIDKPSLDCLIDAFMSCNLIKIEGEVINPYITYVGPKVKFI